MKKSIYRMIFMVRGLVLKTVLSTEKSAALITVMVLILILTILSSVILSLLSNQTRVIEHNVARIKAKYADEAAMVRQLEWARKNIPFGTLELVSGRYDKENQYWCVTVSNRSSPIFPNTQELNLSVDYVPTF